MTRMSSLLFLLGFASLHPSAAFSQGKGPGEEPQFPPTCIVLRAGATIRLSVQSALDNCLPGYAVELAPGPLTTDDSFFIDPITLPPKVSLIVDGGVTVYGTTDASKYQLPRSSDSGAGDEGTPICGTVGRGYPVYGCKPLITFDSDSGIYGYGIIDGQGDRSVRVGNGLISSWWSLLIEKRKNEDCQKTAGDGKPCQQASPLMISAGKTDGSSTNLVLYKITLRNPPFHTVRLAGSHVTVWGVKVQAPWNVPNSDGFDVHGQDILIKDSIVANGDQDVALTSTGSITSNVTIDGLRAYGKGGVALLDDGPGFSGVTIHDFAMTGDLPSVVGSTVNGIPEKDMLAQYGVQYGQALPSATGDTQGMQINTGLNADSLPNPRRMENILFSDVCIADIVRPIHVGPIDDWKTPPTDGYPLIGPVGFRNIDVLPPGPQFVVVDKDGKPPYARGKYSLVLQADPGNRNGITLQNFVFGDQETSVDSLFGSLKVEGNSIAALTNVYPAFFNHLDGPSGHPDWTFDDNLYSMKAEFSRPQMAPPCPPSRLSFLTGELYAGIGTEPTGYWANLRSATVRQSTAVTLFAVVQPAMSQTSQFMQGAYGAEPGLFAIGSPALKGKVTFRDNGKVIGESDIGWNGTLATLTIDGFPEGTHAITADYTDPAEPGFYGGISLPLGAVGITAEK